jgi:RNA polymerase I-specific transcription-initiation factor
LQEVCDLMNQGSTNEPFRKRVHLDDYLQAIRSKIDRSVGIKPGMSLLSDLSSPLLLVADLEASSTTITSLAQSSSIDGQSSSILYPLPGRVGSNSALELYQSLVSDWLSRLPPEVPDRIRVNKERLARNVAAELALAAIATRPSIYDLETQTAQERIYPDLAPPAAVTSASSLDSTLADVTVHSQPISPLPSTADEHPAYVRLRTYTAVSSNAVTLATPTRILDILAHLPSDAETDPSTYDWRTTEATITAEHDESAEKADPRVRRRAEKLAQAKRRRMQLQTKAAEELVRQRAPPAIGSTQMVLQTREVQSSQVMVPERNESGDYGPMTQPERGAFGRRLGGTESGRKDKGKQRTAGF